jgi:hypothetical protein
MYAMSVDKFKFYEKNVDVAILIPPVL